MTTTTITDIIDTYLAAYSEADATTRLDLLARSFTTDGTLTDPPFEGAGHDGINAVMSGVHEHYAGCSFRRVSGIDEHHGQFRYRWEMVGADSAVIATGLDVGALADDGRIERVTGFFEPLPELGSA
jgi:hypothetical protein